MTAPTAPTPPGGAPPALELRGLEVDIVGQRGQRTRILRGVDLTLPKGGVLGLVGESGSGKTMTARSIVSLLPSTAERRWEGCWVDGTGHSENVRWPVAMIFQDPMTSLNPLRRVGFHLLEVVARFQPGERRRGRELGIAALAEVGIGHPERRFRQFPHELSGGMRQRVMIAMALLAKPSLLIADEPTTALDVTVQAQILDLVRQVQAADGLSVLLVTHDMGVIAELCDRVAVMCQGRVVEDGAVDEVFYDARHPYTVGLLAATPGRPGVTHDAVRPSPAEPPQDASSAAWRFGSVGENVPAAWLADSASYTWVSPTHRHLTPAEGV
jgi:ABC-type dipeptide/oligopeptide/nickel transport system ATPase component